MGEPTLTFSRGTRGGASVGSESSRMARSWSSSTATTSASIDLPPGNSTRTSRPRLTTWSAVATCVSSRKTNPVPSDPSGRVIRTTLGFVALYTRSMNACSHAGPRSSSGAFAGCACGAWRGGGEAAGAGCEGAAGGGGACRVRVGARRRRGHVLGGRDPRDEQRREASDGRSPEGSHTPRSCMYVRKLFACTTSGLRGYSRTITPNASRASGYFFILR